MHLMLRFFPLWWLLEFQYLFASPKNSILFKIHEANINLTHSHGELGYSSRSRINSLS